MTRRARRTKFLLSLISRKLTPRGILETLSALQLTGFTLETALQLAGFNEDRFSEEF